MRNSVFWTPELIAELRRRWGEDLVTCAAAMGISRAAVWAKARKLGLPSLGTGRHAHVPLKKLKAMRR